MRESIHVYILSYKVLLNFDYAYGKTNRIGIHIKSIRL
jgi:hypothetical protein